MIVKDKVTGNLININEKSYELFKDRYELPEFDIKSVVIEQEIEEKKEEIKAEKIIEEIKKFPESNVKETKPKGRPKKY